MVHMVGIPNITEHLKIQESAMQLRGLSVNLKRRN